MIFVIVGFSVTVQGGLVPALAHRLGIPLRTVEPEPWSLGVRFSQEPEGLHRYHVAAGAPADGSAVGDLPCGEDAWVSLVIRDGTLLTVGGDTTIRAGDDVLVLADPDETRPWSATSPTPRLPTAPRATTSSPPVGAWAGFSVIGCRWGHTTPPSTVSVCTSGRGAPSTPHDHAISGGPPDQWCWCGV